MNRKEFFKACGIMGIGLPVAASLLESCSGPQYFAKANFSGNFAIIKKSEFVKIDKNKTTFRKYVLLKPEKFNYPICIFHEGGENYSAVLMECTHKGCELKPHGDYLSCPCHGSEFTTRGVVQNPPAEQNLRTFKVRSDNENIYVIFT